MINNRFFLTELGSQAVNNSDTEGHLPSAPHELQLQPPAGDNPVLLGCLPEEESLWLPSQGKGPFSSLPDYTVMSKCNFKA